jgi:integrase
MLTGARRGELLALTWDDVDFQWQRLTIRDKVEGERVIPLPPYLAHLIGALPRRNRWVFSSPTSASGRLQEPNIAHRRALSAAGLPHITLHGLRRSYATLSEWLEVPTGVTAQIMGHKPSAISERHYKRRPVDLLRVWHERIEQWILEQVDVTFDASAPRLRAVV